MAKQTRPVKAANLHSIEQSEFYKLLVNSIQDYAIFLLDTGGNVASWNLGAQKLKGYTPQDIIGSHFSIFYTAEDKKTDKPGRELALCNIYGHIEDEGWRVRKDGTTFWANVVITALRNKAGEIIGYAKITRDLTERKQHEDALHAANEKLTQQRFELEELNSYKDEFISLASHQLRTPASGVKQFLGLLLEGYAGELTPTQTTYVQRAYESNDRQIDLVNSLLRVAQVDAGKVILNRTPVDICALVRDVVDEQKDAFKRRKQTVHIAASAQPIIAWVDAMRFRMVLENLVDNASKYTSPGGTITISVKQRKDTVAIGIKDSGVGIDEESLPKLFTKFSRIPNLLSDSVGGSGLGLYWASKVIGLHGGRIVVTSKPGKGSTFTVITPKE
ncbi:MAG TPA: PAS domain-containing sensor histidine kinase [Candidatus Saccharimonadales bacterium]|nr:PAS domain-containing sensor histidine kinase [Candidatus Saccharimonadales bacterium]